MATTRTTTCEPDVDDDWRIVLTKTYAPGWLARLLGRKPSQTSETYVGECTVWHRLPSFERPGTLMEGMLAEIWERERYRRKGGKQ